MHRSTARRNGASARISLRGASAYGREPAPLTSPLTARPPVAHSLIHGGTDAEPQ
jgi:hypothetical protein